MEMRLIVPLAEASGMTDERWTRLWDKNWQILLDVLHQEDFPVLRNSQKGMQSADAGRMMLGRNVMANQGFSRPVREMPAQNDNRTKTIPDVNSTDPKKKG